VDHIWLGWQDLNLRMPESKSGALPLGDIPPLKDATPIINEGFILCQAILLKTLMKTLVKSTTKDFSKIFL
jgi:hypothetical protein